MTAPALRAVVAAAMLMASGHSAAQSTDADVKRYEQVVSAVPLTIQVQDCLEFASLVEQALSGK